MAEAALYSFETKGPNVDNTEAVTEPSPLRLIVLMPLRDDWSSAAELIRRLDKAVDPGVCTLEIVLVDDGSAQRCERRDFQQSYTAVQSIQVLRLRRNLGHQRAIAIGLVHVQEKFSCDAVVVMDADGEDTAEGMARLVQAYVKGQGATAVFAERSRRTESFTFKVFYQLYKTLHFWLTGIRVQVGNFSIIPFTYLNTLVVMSELWNHYAAAVFRSKLRYTMTPIPRGTRIAGTSSMNFVALVSHGLSAISVFGDIVGVRLMIASLAGSLVAGLGILVVVLVRLFSQWAIPGWATSAAGILAIIAIQLISIATSFTFFVLSNRTNLSFVPLRDSSWFVEEAVEVYSHG